MGLDCVRKALMGKTQKLTALIFSFTLTACGANKSAQQIAQSSLGNLGCKTFQSEMWNSLYAVAETGEAFPEAADLRKALLEAGAQKGWKGSNFERFVDRFVDSYQVTIEGIQQRLGPEDPEAWKKALAEMEIGVRVTSVHAELADKVEASLAKTDEAEEQLDAVCEVPDDTSEAGGRAPAGELDPVVNPNPSPDPGATYDTFWKQVKANYGAEVYGARKTLAIAYQSCDVNALAPMNDGSPTVKGISITGTHSSGGKKREVTDLPALLASNYYMKGSLAKSSCFDVRKNPLIYDFGGKPATSSSRPNELDLFKNGGSGTKALGIDCSAYVFSALALGGLRLDTDPAKVMKASLVSGVGSGAFKEPQKNGLRCLDKIAVSKTKTVLPGDIIAINGHVVMIDEVGADPFGLNKISKVEDCNSSKVLATNFDFVIAQSSPVKGGIGIDRYEARDYVPSSSTFKTGLVAYAVAACKAKFGGSATVSSPNLSVVRHKKTKECLSSAPLTTTYESCVDSCKAL